MQGDGRNFAWIVPLPAVPRIEASTRGLFPTLEALCSPRVDTKDHHAWAFVAAIGIVLVLAARWGGRRPRVAALMVCGALCVLVRAAVAVSVPKMQDSGAAGDAASVPRVLQRNTVGAFDTAILDARDAKSLRAWLCANGFRALDGIDAVVDDYAARGWVFVASKLRAEAAEDGVRAVHPLAFEFASPRPVYPMRLTGAVNETGALELFVFGSMRAEAYR